MCDRNLDQLQRWPLGLLPLRCDRRPLVQRAELRSQWVRERTRTAYSGQALAQSRLREEPQMLEEPAGLVWALVRRLLL